MYVHVPIMLLLFFFSQGAKGDNGTRGDRGDDGRRGLPGENNVMCSGRLALFCSNFRYH